MVQDDGEYNESEEDDRLKFADQLSAIGELGRLLPEHSIGLLARLLEERVCRLHAQLQLLAGPGPGGGDAAVHAEAQLQQINEDLHWLLLISSMFLVCRFMLNICDPDVKRNYAYRGFDFGLYFALSQLLGLCVTLTIACSCRGF